MTLPIKGVRIDSENLDSPSIFLDCRDKQPVGCFGAPERIISSDNRGFFRMRVGIARLAPHVHQNRNVSPHPGRSTDSIIPSINSHDRTKTPRH
nr:MAG TPA: hypothetical protein [Caudoviricetes sp.]